MKLTPLLHPLDPIQSAIIEILAEHTLFQVQTLMNTIEEKYGLSISQGNFYRIIGQMIDAQI